MIERWNVTCLYRSVSGSEPSGPRLKANSPSSLPASMRLRSSPLWCPTAGGRAPIRHRCTLRYFADGHWSDRKQQRFFERFWCRVPSGRPDAGGYPRRASPLSGRAGSAGEGCSDPTFPGVCHPGFALGGDHSRAVRCHSRRSAGGHGPGG